VAVIACTGDIALLDGLHGDRTLCIARDGQPFQGRPVNRITFARWGTDHPEDVVVCRTSENEFEIHCHGGRAAVERIRAELAPVTGQNASAPDTREVDERHQLLAAAWDAVSRATTLRTADLLLHQAAEAWPTFLERKAAPPAGPHPEDDLPSPRSNRRPAVRDESLAWADFGRHLTDPWVVALVGKPNAGKSSLMNALAGFQRSIVNPTPGTTRDAVTLDVAFDGWPIRLVDTAGLREGADELEAAGIDRARRVMTEADLVLHVFDATEPPPAFLTDALPVANKIDLCADSHWPAVISRVSALTGTGIDRLIARIITELIPSEPPQGLAIPISDLHFQWLNSSSLNSES